MARIGQEGALPLADSGTYTQREVIRMLTKLTRGDTRKEERVQELVRTSFDLI